MNNILTFEAVPGHLWPITDPQPAVISTQSVPLLRLPRVTRMHIKQGCMMEIDIKHDYLSINIGYVCAP